MGRNDKANTAQLTGGRAGFPTKACGSLSPLTCSLCFPDSKAPHLTRTTSTCSVVAETPSSGPRSSSWGLRPRPTITSGVNQTPASFTLTNYHKLWLDTTHSHCLAVLGARSQKPRLDWFFLKTPGRTNSLPASLFRGALASFAPCPLYESREPLIHCHLSPSVVTSAPACLL